MLSLTFSSAIWAMISRVCRISVSLSIIWDAKSSFCSCSCASWLSLSLLSSLLVKTSISSCKCWIVSSYSFTFCVDNSLSCSETKSWVDMISFSSNSKSAVLRLSMVKESDLMIPFNVVISRSKESIFRSHNKMEWSMLLATSVAASLTEFSDEMPASALCDESNKWNIVEAKLGGRLIVPWQPGNILTWEPSTGESPSR